MDLSVVRFPSQFCRNVLVITVVTLGLQAQARLFQNSYVSFELPSNWKCHVENTEWICQSQYPNQSKQAVIILTAKEKGPTDSFRAYYQYLKKPRQLRGKLSKIYHLKQNKINNHPWLDGMHLSAELPGFYTRYLATIKENIAILVTFSAHKLYYTKFSADFFRAIKSLRVVASKNVANASKLPSMGYGQGMIGGAGAGFYPQGPNQYPEEPGSGNDKRTTYFGLALLLLAAAVYMYLKKGRQPRGRAKRPTSSRKTRR